MALTQISTKGLKDGTILNADINASAAIAGTKISPSFTSNIILTNANPSISLLDSDANSDFKINVNGGIFSIKDQTNVDATRLGINSSGNVFVGGSSSVGTKLHIENASGDAHIRLRGSANYGVLFTRHSDAALTGYVGSGNAVNLGTANVALSAPLSGGHIIFQTNGTAATDEKMRIKDDGKIGINTTAPSELFTINGADQSALIRTSNAVGTAKLKFEADGTNYAGIGLENTSLVFRCSNSSTPTSRMTIAADGLVTVSGDLAVTSSLAKIKLNDTDGGDQFQIRNDGGNFKIRNSTDGRDDINITNNNITLGGVLTIQDNNSIFFGSSQDIEMRHNATSSSNQIISKNHDFLLLSNDSIHFQIFASGNSNNQAILTLQNTAITSYRDIRVDRGTAGIDGIVGQAYAGYFGLKHADHTINQEYMILNNGVDHTYISCSSNAGVYIRPDANSVTHETFFGINDTQFNTNILMQNHYLTRNDFSVGFLVGAQNNQGASDAKTNPIFTIGTSHLPNNTSLVDMYGIGYTNGNASFIPSGLGWGMYVAADGNARIYLDGSNGDIHFADGARGSVVFSNGNWSGDKSTGKIQTHNGHMYLQNAGNTSSWVFRLPNGTQPFIINYQGGTSSSDRRLKKDITTITSAVDTIKKLIGRSFTWKEADVKGFGVIAQEVEAILPEVISTQTVIEGEDNDDPYKMINYGSLSGHFIEAIKELATKIEELETEVAALKAS